MLSRAPWHLPSIITCLSFFLVFGHSHLLYQVLLLQVWVYHPAIIGSYLPSKDQLRPLVWWRQLLGRNCDFLLLYLLQQHLSLLLLWLEHGFDEFLLFFILVEAGHSDIKGGSNIAVIVSYFIRVSGEKSCHKLFKVQLCQVPISRNLLSSLL